MRIKKVFICIVLCFLLTGCGNDNKIVSDSQNKSNNVVKIVDKSIVGQGGYILENNIYDYSMYMDEVFEWTEGVKMPFDRPDDVKIEFNSSGLVITDFESNKFDEYIEKLEAKKFSLCKFSREDSVNIELNVERYLLYKDNMIVIFDKYEDEIMVYVTVGNVVGKRNVTVADVKTMLGEDYNEHIVLEISYESVSEEGFYEFIVIPLNYYSLEDDKSDTCYIIADEEEILLNKEGIWNQAYPMTVNLLGDELIINYNDTAGSRSGASVYPELIRYKYENGKFVLKETKNLPMGSVIIGKNEGEMKYYYLKENEDYNASEGRKNIWVIKEEYKLH